jgi:hypothetical protein
VLDRVASDLHAWVNAHAHANLQLRWGKTPEWTDPK